MRCMDSPMCELFYENMNTRYYVEGVHTYGVSIYMPTTVLMFNMNKCNIPVNNIYVNFLQEV